MSQAASWTPRRAKGSPLETRSPCRVGLVTTGNHVVEGFFECVRRARFPFQEVGELPQRLGNNNHDED